MRYIDSNNLEPVTALQISARIIRGQRYRETLTPAQLHWKKCSKWSVFSLKLFVYADRAPRDGSGKAGNFRSDAMQARSEASYNQRMAGMFS